MPAVVVRNIPSETHRALKQRARKKGVSTEAEIRSILNQAVGKQEAFVSAWEAFSKGSKKAANLEFDLPDREPYVPTVKFD